MNFVCIVFELGDKMLTLSSMENLIVQCNLKAIGWGTGVTEFFMLKNISCRQ